jgi:hypothetical protein
MAEFQVNVLAVLVSAIAAFAMGALWYSLLESSAQHLTALQPPSAAGS